MGMSIRMIALYSLLAVTMGTGVSLLLRSTGIQAGHRLQVSLGIALITGLMIVIDRLIHYQRSLKESKRNLDEAQQLARLGSWERNLVTGTGYWSENHFRLFGLPPGNHAPTMDDFFRLIHEADRTMARETVYEAIRTGGSYEIQYRLADDPANRIFFSRGTVHTGDGGGALRILGTVQDITEKRQQEELREQLLKQKEQFISRLGHDLKTPLTPLVALLPLVRSGAGDERQREIVDICIRNAEYIRELAAKTIQLARLSSGTRPQAALVDLRLRATVSDCLANMADTVVANGIRIENLIGPDIVAQADTNDLGELFRNLIGNALKFSPHDSLVTIDAVAEEGIVTVMVRDTGCGLTPEEQVQIFDEFYKADPSRHDLGSSGLGLSICRRIVENHGGRIWAESPGTGRGTAICFTLVAGGAS